MRWSEAMTPVRMRRVALLAPDAGVRDMLVRVAATGAVQLDDIAAQDRSAPEVVLSRHTRTGATPALSATPPDLADLERDGRDDLLAGEAQLQRYATCAQHRHDVAALTGWCPSHELDSLTTRLATIGGSVVILPHPPGVDPPTMIGDDKRLERALSPLVTTYGVVPYRDLDPTIPSGIAYMVMFGMMFGDAGHGALILVAAVLLRSGRIRRLAGLRKMWPFVAGAGLMATVFGVLYGEFFGPTGVLPVLWLAPLTDPMRLLATAVAAGAVLLGIAYGFGIINRWREGGLRLSLYASTGIAGATLFLGLGIAVGWYLLESPPMLIVGAIVIAVGLSLAVVGLFVESGGGASGVIQTGVSIFDLVTRLGSNLISFTRLAAFGMTHAALGWVVWRGTVALTGMGGLGIAAGVLTFAVGNVITFTLEALVAGIQALRLEYYELFSRVFVDEGNPFRPWRIPTSEPEGASC